MKKQFPLKYRTIQRIKAEEYERFFSRIPGYYCYMNHLGEVRWMTEAEAEKQHEFFIYDESALMRWKRRLQLNRKIRLEKLSLAEKEIRLRIRLYLARKQLGEPDPKLAAQAPEQWKYELDDEYIQNMPITLETGSEGVWKIALGMVGVLAVVALISYFWVADLNRVATGKLLVKSEVIGARIYMDEEHFLGYNNVELDQVPAGLHRISAYKEGYVSLPRFHEIMIQPDSLITLTFQFKRARSQVTGWVDIRAQRPESRIFVDKNFVGRLEDFRVLALEEGQHTLSIDADGFVTRPAEKIINIAAGDTSPVFFQQSPLPRRSGRGTSPAADIGSIEVTSDVKNARIFLNNKDTGQKTDYVFTQFPLGRYSIRVEKEGYTVEPQEKEVRLTGSKPVASANFSLVQNFGKISIFTEPAEGSIYIDGEFKATGQFEGIVGIGEHQLSFGDISGYKKPRSRTVTIRSGQPLNLTGKYFPDTRMQAGVDRNGNLFSKSCELFTGFTFRNRAFTISQEAGPSIEFNERTKDYLIKLGFAFPYRNPRGNDALRVEFHLPQNLDYDQTFTLRMLAAVSHEKYPLSMESKVDIRLRFNGTELSEFYQPKYLEDLGGLEIVEWDITPYIRSGKNVFQVATTENNNNFFYMKRIEIFN